MIVNIEINNNNVEFYSGVVLFSFIFRVRVRVSYRVIGLGFRV